MQTHWPGNIGYLTAEKAAWPEVAEIVGVCARKMQNVVN